MNGYFIVPSIVLLLTVNAGAGEPARTNAEMNGEKRIDFHTAPTVRAFAKNDTARVMTIATANLGKQNGLDILTVQTNGMLNAIFNNGSGKLQNKYSNDSAVNLEPNVAYLAASDLNGDGYSDAVAIDTKNGAFLVFLNTGDGAFAPAQSISVGSENESGFSGGGLAVADVNADGRPDVVTVTRASSTGTTTFSLQTFLGTGDGTFEALTRIDSALPGEFTLAPGNGLAVADMNRDGNPDLVAQLQENRPAPGIRVAVSLGAGDGTFESISSEGTSAPAGPQPASSLVVGDLNGDELPDAVFVAFSDAVYVAMGQPDGTLTDPSPVLSNMSGVVLLSLGDVNKDGALDLVAFGSGELGVFAGRGDGTFQATSQYTGGYGIVQQPAPLDLNGDGNLDIAWLDYTNGRIGSYFGHGDGTFAAASPVRPSNPGNTEWAGNIQVITAADMNGDSNQDVLAYDWPHASAGGPADLYTGLNDGTGKFAFELALPKGKLQELAQHYGSVVVESATADFNGDLRADVIFRTQSGLAVLLAQADGTLDPIPIDIQFPVPVSCMPFNYLTTGDVNGDGFTDIVAGYIQNRNCGPSASTPSGVFVLLGDGAGRFDAKFTPFGEGIFFVRLGDMNGDGKLDLLAANTLSGRGFNLYVLAGGGDGSFDFTNPRIVIGGQFVSDILVADYNGDGKQDLVLPTAGAPDENGAPVRATAGVLLLPGAGDFTFGEPAKVLDGISPIWNGSGWGDFNNDEKPDLVFAIYSKAEPHTPHFGVVVLPNNGDGTFADAISLLTPLGVSGRNAVVFVSDFNKDDREDVLAGSGLSSPLFLNAPER